MFRRLQSMMQNGACSSAHIFSIAHILMKESSITLCPTFYISSHVIYDDAG